MELPHLNELLGLATQIPPSERVGNGDVANVLSAIIAVGHYGEDILTAAKDGQLAQFYHDHITANKPEGADDPVRGNTAVQVAAPAGAIGTATTDVENKVNALESKVDAGFAAIMDAIKGSAPADTTTPTPTPTPDPATVDTPAPENPAVVIPTTPDPNATGA